MLRFLLRIAFKKGVMGGSRVWTVIGGAALGLRLLKRLTASEPEVVYRKSLRPGESLLISHDRQPRSVRSPS